MPSNIQLAAEAIDAEHMNIGTSRPGRDAAINVVMRLQLQNSRLREMLDEALEREQRLTENLRNVLTTP